MQIQLYSKKVWIYKEPVNFNKSIDGLVALTVNIIKHNPQQGVYVFFNRQKNKIKLLSWHKNGFALFYKRLEKGKFSFNFNNSAGVMESNAEEIAWMLAGLDWQNMRNWKELSYDKFE